MKKITAWVPYMDLIRLSAIFAVVVIHVSTPLAINYSNLDLNWFISYGYYITSRWGVPVLFMISGALLLTAPNESIKSFLTKRFSKIIIPFIFWNIFYTVFKLIKGNEFDMHGLTYTLTHQQIFYHMWFLYVLIGLYLLTPMLKVYVQNASNKNILYFLFLWFVMTCILPIVGKFANIILNVQFEAITGYIGYFILGYYLHNRITNFNSKLLFTIFFFSTLLVIVLDYIVISNYGNINRLFFGNFLSPFMVLQAFAIFLLLKKTKIGNYINKFELHLGIDKQLGRICFGIYLVHPLFMSLLYALSSTYKLSITQHYPLIAIPALSIFVFSACFIIFALITKLNKYFIIKKVSRLIY